MKAIRRWWLGPLLFALTAGAAHAQETAASSIDRFAVSAGTIVNAKMGGPGLYFDLHTPPFLLGRKVGLQLRYQGEPAGGALFPDVQALRAEMAYSVASQPIVAEGSIYTFRLGADLTWSDQQAAPPNGAFLIAPEVGSTLTFQRGRSRFTISDTLSFSGIGTGFEAGVGYGFGLFSWLLMTARVTSVTTLAWNGLFTAAFNPALFVTVLFGR